MLEESSWYCEYSSFDYRLTKIKNVNRNIRIELKSGYAKIKALDNQGLLDSLKLNEIYYMETAGIEPASRNSDTSVTTRVVCLFRIRTALCRQTGVLCANLEISCY